MTNYTNEITPEEIHIWDRARHIQRYLSSSKRKDLEISVSVSDDAFIIRNKVTVFPNSLRYQKYAPYITSVVLEIHVPVNFLTYNGIFLAGYTRRLDYIEDVLAAKRASLYKGNESFCGKHILGVSHQLEANLVETIEEEW